MCFEHRKGRTKYLGQADLYVCLNGPCLEEHTRRKKVAREKLGAERAAAKEAADAAKAKARAEKLLAKAAARRAPRVAAPKAKTKPKAAPSFFRQGIAAAEVTDDEVEVEEEVGGAPTAMAVGMARLVGLVAQLLENVLRGVLIRDAVRQRFYQGRLPDRLSHAPKALARTALAGCSFAAAQ